MGILLLGFLLCSEVFLGVALVCYAGRTTMLSMFQCEKIGTAVLLGLAAAGYLCLLNLFGGSSAKLLAPISLAVMLLVAGKLGNLKSFAAVHAGGSRLLDTVPLPFRLFTFGTLAVLLTWATLAALFLPTTDYDGLASWTYRIKVLLRERSFWSDSLQDPVRFVNVRQHPYLLTAIEFIHVAAWRKFSFSVIHLPHLLAYAGFVFLGLGAVLQEQKNGRPLRATALFAGLLLMPAVAVQLSLESVREVIIGYYGFAAVYFLAKWSDNPRWWFLLCATLFGVTGQQIKIEGMVLLLGLGCGAILIVASEKNSRFRRARLLQVVFATALATALALPWMIVMRLIRDPLVHGYDFSTDAQLNLTAQLRVLPSVLRLQLSELLARPELYGLTPLIIIFALCRDWTWRTAPRRLALLGAPAACIAGILVIYIGRNDRLPPERNYSFSRRMMTVVPALTFASLRLPRRYRVRGKHGYLNY